MARSVAGSVPSSCSFAFVNFSVQRRACPCGTGTPACLPGSGLPEDRLSPRWYCAALALPPAWHPGSGRTSADTSVTQGGVKAPEQLLDGDCLGQTLAKQSDRFGIGHPVRQSQTEETHEGQAVVDQIFRSLVGEIVQRLDDQDLEHQHRIERATAAFAPI